MTLTLAMITKDSLKDLKRLRPLVEPYIDEWVVVFPPGDKAIDWAEKNGIKAVVKDFTTPVEPDIRKQMAERYGLKLSKNHRLFRFADARNESYANATGDLVLWLDADDEPVGMENIRTLLEGSNYDCYNAVYDYFRDAEGNPIADHVRERVTRNNGKFTWRGAKLGLIHETLVTDPGYSPFQADIPKDLFYVKHQSDHGLESSDRNYAALIYEYLTTGGEDPRNTYYLGVELYNHGLFGECARTMIEYTKRGGWDEERYRAWMKAGDAYMQLNDYESAANSYLSGLKELPEWPDAYFKLGETYFYQQQYPKAVEFLMTGMGKEIPKTKSPIDKVSYTFRPAGHLALAYLQIGNQEKAHWWFDKAKQLNPSHPWIAEHQSLFEEALLVNDYVKAFVKLGQLSQQRFPKMLTKLSEAIPDELIDQELLMDFKWRYTTPKVWSDKSIVFFCGTVYEPWGPESLTTGIGGSEEAVIQLAPRLVKLGWEVTVYNNCIKEGIVDGVDWVRYERFNPRDMFNVLVSWRHNIFPRARSAMKRYIDCHDVLDPSQYTKDALQGAKLLVKSQAHRVLVPDLPDEMVRIIPNGIDTDKFNGSGKKKNNLVSTSSYDRGLEHLLEMWTDIRKEVPDTTLDIAYGWDLYDKTPAGTSLEGQEWKARMERLFQQDGITVHGRVSHDEVAKLYNQAEVFAYPSHFYEIDCISLTKAQAALAIPVTTTIGSLAERNQGVLVEGDIRQKEVAESFKRELIALLKDDERKAQLATLMDVSRFSWDVVAKQWSDEIAS